MPALPHNLTVGTAPAAPRSDRRDHPNWTADGHDWPNRAASRFVQAGNLRWHVQIMGQGPVLLLLHGTGAATHSWRGLLPLLAADFTVVAPDLPGHGFTEEPPVEGMSLPGMTRGVAALLAALELAPTAAVGHSAGAAVLAEMCLRNLIAPAALVSLNGALLPFENPASVVFAPLAKLLARNRLVPMLFSLHATDPRVVARLLRGTGSTIDAEGLKFYGRLARRSGHAGAALKMMANWDLPALASALQRLQTPLLLVVGGNDRSIPPSDGERARRLVRHARLLRLPNLGHLAHEERPAEVAALILDFVRSQAP